ncbi:HTH domain-containing protein [Natronobacterium gregoryi]|uniref:Uncharacterized protein n=2 Tax=Natronobacterium gregoryi TaxID=44930 RepID=L0AM07_NATGS|nr:HTH domain-containing protein [Natronobacterium gregoryi]AFZ74928.1 hypothetical protein Natgr_3834 [Natronobacterium gregoryi SP2]ELY67361.1 hypothetical protein C490_11156 [Natronobacterium gregoryi SP2]PLK19855.1 hypothetical protein CYV19_12650 [Natronobacterium gregoryi SP2]SFJ39266.1 hypothetical protein SAMN05443661_12625 [Natronobacterium gregoryi]
MTGAPLTTVCHVRTPLLLEPMDSQVETLQACESETQIDDLLLRSWPKEVTRSENSPHQEVLETYERFRSWADQRGVSVRPPFRERTRTSPVTGETRELLVTPLLCLEIYHDDELIGVFPHSEGEETYTTDEAIAALRTGEVPTPLGKPPTEATGENDGFCPDCGASLVDGQGLFICRECGWLGTVDGSGRFVSREAESRKMKADTPTVQ